VILVLFTYSILGGYRKVIEHKECKPMIPVDFSNKSTPPAVLKFITNYKKSICQPSQKTGLKSDSFSDNRNM